MLPPIVHEWLCHNSTPFESTSPQSQLSEREKDFLDSVIQSAEIIALGEMTHGSKEVFCSKDRLLRYMTENHGISVIVLEANQGSTRALNDCVLSGQGDLASALAETGFWSIANEETAAFVKWLAEHNGSLRDPATRVKILGCDIQSLDDGKNEISFLLRVFVDQRIITESDCSNIFSCIEKLPKDRELYKGLEPYFEELGTDEPNSDRLAQFQQRQAQFIETVRKTVSDIVASLCNLKPIIADRAAPEDSFFFGRCIRLLEQCLDFYTFEQGGRTRDRYMAENILALRDLFPQQKIVLTSANWHISRVPIPIQDTEDYVTMGSILTDELAEKYCAMGSAFCEGYYLGVAGDSSRNDDVVVETHVPKPNTFEYWLNEFASETAIPDFMINLRRSRRDTQAFPWSDTLRMNIGEAAPKQSYDTTFLPQRPELQFDALLYFTKTTPISVLPDYYLYSRKKWGK